MVLCLGCSQCSRTLPAWTSGGAGLEEQTRAQILALAHTCAPACPLAAPALPPLRFLCFSVLGPPRPALAADLESCFLLGLQPVTAAALGAPGALAAPAAPGVARAPRAAAPPRDSSPAAVTMATPVRYGTLPASLSLSWFKLAAPALVRPQSQVPASNLLFC